MPQTRKEETFDVLKRWISTQLECLLCVEIMTPPIVVCSNGHMICNNCKPKLDKCHFCRAIITSRKNIFAEEISKLLKVRCSYAHEGCQVQESPDKIEEHEVACFYQPVECLAGSGAQCVVKCGWRGRKCELLGHVAYQHSMTMIHPDLPIRFISPYIYEQDYTNISLICAHSECFWLTLKYDMKKNRRFEGVHFIGHAKKAKEFRYRCDLLSCDGKTGTTFFSTTGSIFHETDDVFDTTHHFQMDLDVFKQLYVDKDGKVPGYKLIIEKVRHSE
ncbi:hypothetical protein B7P43_G14755 [Cryptotermes secundus]|uniref:RING-type E3 ubiquitin transferase n=2 Tax=Cryptotermes secundus TaxID=105785 RepID=A0A2J7PTT3_9NEOP|nr:hypothetical protein B7P43_G14755 [Cryptotermes secundus]